MVVSRLMKLAMVPIREKMGEFERTTDELRHDRQELEIGNKLSTSCRQPCCPSKKLVPHSHLVTPPSHQTQHATVPIISLRLAFGRHQKLHYNGRLYMVVISHPV